MTSCTPSGGEANLDAPSGCLDTLEKGSYRSEVLQDGACQVTAEASLSGAADADQGGAHTVCCSD